MVGLKGKNQVAKFRQVARRLVAQISPLEGVCGIVLLGGLARGFADRFSDVDVIVFLTKKDNELSRKIRSIGSDASRLSGLDVDLEVDSLANFGRWKMDEVVMWDISRAEIAFDPKYEVAEAFERKFRVPKSFWVKRVAVCAEYLKWYCCPPSEGIGTIADSWIQRGDFASAHFCLNYAIDLMLQLAYALNKEFLPAPKWRVFYADSLKWLPPDFRNLIQEAMIVESLSIDELERRIKTIRKVWTQFIPKIEQETGLTLDLLSKYFVKTVLNQT
jgi:predicted nucleotidyltransferase